MRVVDLYIGFDSREPEAYRVCAQSAVRKSADCVVTRPLVQEHLRREGFYYRESMPGNDPGVVIDNIDRRPFSTEFAFTRFLVPMIHQSGWAIFCDCDFLFLDDIGKVLDLADPKYAVMLVKHEYDPPEKTKMDGAVQTHYPRKNWSSFVLWNCDHPAHTPLKRGVVNEWTGRKLHTFSWLSDDLIGSLPENWNWLEGHSSHEIVPSAIHFTRGGPWFESWRGVKHGYLWEWENRMREMESNDFFMLKRIRDQKVDVWGDTKRQRSG